ncbi:MAG: flippase [bacterium]|nr:flippase [bacterium]
MSIGRKIFYNTLAQSLGKIFAVIIGLVTLGFLSRYLGEQGFGQYSTIIAVLGLFATLADMGLYLYTVREISKPDTNHKKVISNALGLRLVSAMTILVVGSLITLVFPYDPLVKKTIFVGIAAFLFISLNQVLVGIFQKHLVQYLIVAAETVGRLVNLALVYFFIRQALGLPHFIAALILANATIFFLTLFFAKRLEKFSIEFDLQYWKEILRVSWPLIFAVILNLVYFKTDTVILSLFYDAKTVGIYSLPYKLLEGLLAFPAMFVGLIMPLLSASAFKNWVKFKQILQYSFDAVYLMAIPIIVTVLFFTTEIIDLLRGSEEYLDSPALLQILIFAAATIFFGTLFGYSVVAVNQQKAMIKGYLLGAIIGLFLYFILIPPFAYWGAAIGTIITEIVVAAYAYFLVRKTSGQKISWKIAWLSLPGAIVMVGFFYFIEIFWILEILVGILLYASISILTKAVPFEFVRNILFVEKTHQSIHPPSHES